MKMYFGNRRVIRCGWRDIMWILRRKANPSPIGMIWDCLLPRTASFMISYRSRLPSGESLFLSMTIPRSDSWFTPTRFCRISAGNREKISQMGSWIPEGFCLKTSYMHRIFSTMMWRLSKSMWTIPILRRSFCGGKALRSFSRSKITMCFAGR